MCVCVSQDSIKLKTATKRWRQNSGLVVNKRDIELLILNYKACNEQNKQEDGSYQKPKQWRVVRRAAVTIISHRPPLATLVPALDRHRPRGREGIRRCAGTGSTHCRPKLNTSSRGRLNLRLQQQQHRRSNCTFQGLPKPRLSLTSALGTSAQASQHRTHKGWHF